MLTYLYHTRLGRCLLKILTWPALSGFVGRFLDSKASRRLIPGFIRRNQLDLTDYRPENWSSFNAFFVRGLKPGRRPIDRDPSAFIAPCDGLLSVYSIRPDQILLIKNSYYTTASLLQSRKLAEQFAGGQCLIFRLTPSHYHRYCYPDSGRKSRNRVIPGVLHTVQPIATDACKVYQMNSREYTILRTNHFGDMVFMEVGAMLVGRIQNYHQAGTFRRGQEKGRFEFGGSTIVVLLKKDSVKLQEEILAASANHLEYPVHMGSRLN